MPSFRQPVPERFEQAGGPIETKWNLRDQAIVDMLPRQRRVTGNETRMATHQLHQTDPVHGAHRFDMSARHRFHRFGKRRVKAKALVEVHDVVVDGLWNPNHHPSAPAPANFSVNFLATAQRSIPSHNEQHVHAELIQVIDHFASVLWTTGTPKDCSAKGMNRGNGFGSQGQRNMAKPRYQSFIAISEPEDPRDPVPMIELHHDSPNNVVQTGTEPPAGNDGGGCFRRIEVNLLTRPSHLEIKRTQSPFEHVANTLHRIVVDYAMFFRSKPINTGMPVPQRR